MKRNIRLALAGIGVAMVVGTGFVGTVISPVRSESAKFRRPNTPRFPIATLDPRVSFNPQLSQARMRDLMAD